VILKELRALGATCRGDETAAWPALSSARVETTGWAAGHEAKGYRVSNPRWAVVEDVNGFAASQRELRHNRTTEIQSSISEWSLSRNTMGTMMRAQAEPAESLLFFLRLVRLVNGTCHAGLFNSRLCSTPVPQGFGSPAGTINPKNNKIDALISTFRISHARRRSRDRRCRIEIELESRCEAFLLTRA